MSVEPREAAMRVLLDESPEALHWTVVWDLALQRGYIDPFTQAGARDEVVRALAQLARAGEIERTSTGTYRVQSGASP